MAPRAQIGQGKWLSTLNTATAPAHEPGDVVVFSGCRLWV